MGPGDACRVGTFIASLDGATRSLPPGDHSGIQERVAAGRHNYSLSSLLLLT